MIGIKLHLLFFTTNSTASAFHRSEVILSEHCPSLTHLGSLSPRFSFTDSSLLFFVSFCLQLPFSYILIISNALLISNLNKNQETRRSSGRTKVTSSDLDTDTDRRAIHRNTRHEKKSRNYTRNS